MRKAIITCTIIQFIKTNNLVRIFYLPILPLLFLCFPNVAFSQLHNDIKQVEHLFKLEEDADYSIHLKQSKNELEATASLLFLFYKEFISSQDIDACVFYPSCSVYSMECLSEEKNTIIALLKISDRLMRCHPLASPASYPIHKKTGKLYDPVEH